MDRLVIESKSRLLFMKRACLSHLAIMAQKKSEPDTEDGDFHLAEEMLNHIDSILQQLE